MGCGEKSSGNLTKFRGCKCEPYSRSWEVHELSHNFFEVVHLQHNVALPVMKIDIAIIMMGFTIDIFYCSVFVLSCVVSLVSFGC